MILNIEDLNIEGLNTAQNEIVTCHIEEVLRTWEGTPYMVGCQVKQAGVDCVRFVSGVIDDLYVTHTELPRLPQDASFHSRDTCQAALRSFMSRYNYVSVSGPTVQPGDVLIAGPRGGGPGHALIAGSNCLWHCDSRSVTRTGLSFTTGGVYFLKKILRGADRERWYYAD